MQELKKLQNKKIAILGLGLENLALVKYILNKKINCEITVCDSRGRKELDEKYKELNKKGSNIKWQLGKNYNKNFYKFDILFRSPGWPISKVKSQKLKVKSCLSSPMQLFFELCPTKNIIGVTGTKGKGTTSSLIYKILCAAGKQVWLGGNIGMAPFDFFVKIKKTDWVVLELSSFHLEDMAISPHISVITNFYPEHLTPTDPNNPNFHKSLKDYYSAKLNISKWQKKGDWTILNFKLQINTDCHALITRLTMTKKAKIIYFKKSELSSQLIGEHNKENIATAVKVAKIVGVKQEAIKKAIANFKSLPHRLEFVKNIREVKYYDDSFATMPESTIIALKSFNQPIIILLGGADKRADFKDLAAEVKKRCKFVVLLNGKATPMIQKELLKIKFNKNKTKLVDNIKDAVVTAYQHAIQSDIVLLSTACASFGMFKNYKERGDLFKAEVKKIK
ncbi:UDP-N-acetylmuramoyl-L-alanine--D-glutamate ligase [Patescibacteria group bacterium]|nr:UDP-N-acetylmuramoyl-L-alanine--D-glutamate ligase [Patescibacteria group bacterium]